MNLKPTKSFFLSVSKSDFIQEIVFSGIGCGLFVILFRFLPKDYVTDSVNRATFCSIMILSFFIVFIIINQVTPKNKLLKVSYKRNIIIFSIFNFATMCFLFYYTPFGDNGLVGDNFYRSAYITQMAHSGYPQDFIYKDLSAYYSPFYWYLLALFAILFQIKPYKMIRIGFLFTMYILPIILFEFWNKIYSKKISFIITTLSFVLLNNISIIDHVIGYMLIVPFFMYYYENFPGRQFKTKDYVIGGIIGSIIFCTFFFYFIIIPIYYLISLIQNKNEFKAKLKHILYISFFVILFSSWFWAPLLKDILLIGFESHQNRYYGEILLRVPFYNYFRASLLGAVLLSGFLFIIKEYKFARDLMILGRIILSIYIIFIIGFIGILIEFPILHIRVLSISFCVLVVASSIFYVNLFYFLAKHDFFKKKSKKDINFKQIEVFFLILVIFVQSYVGLKNVYDSPSYQQAYDEDINSNLIEIFEELDYEDKVFLTTKWKVAAYLPIYLFLLPNPYFSHPSSLYNERVKFLIELSECETSKKFHEKITDNEFGPIDYFFLDFKDNSTKLVFEVAVENFPDGRDYYDIEFDRELFEDPRYFKKIEIEGKIIYKTRY